MEMKEYHSKRFNVLTTKSQIEEVREASMFYGCSVSHFVRQCVTYGLLDYRIKRGRGSNE